MGAAVLEALHLLPLARTGMVGLVESESLPRVATPLMKSLSYCSLLLVGFMNAYREEGEVGVQLASLQPPGGVVGDVSLPLAAHAAAPANGKGKVYN